MPLYDVERRTRNRFLFKKKKTDYKGCFVVVITQTNSKPLNANPVGMVLFDCLKQADLCRCLLKIT